jgi:hypothetical protein
MSVYCSTTITGADGKVTESSCTEETSSTDSSSMTFADPPSPPDFSADLNAMELELESVMNELMAGLFDES